LPVTTKGRGRKAEGHIQPSRKQVDGDAHRISATKGPIISYCNFEFKLTVFDRRSQWSSAGKKRQSMVGCLMVRGALRPRDARPGLPMNTVCRLYGLCALGPKPESCML